MCNRYSVTRAYISTVRPRVAADVKIPTLSPYPNTIAKNSKNLSRDLFSIRTGNDLRRSYQAKTPFLKIACGKIADDRLASNEERENEKLV